MITRNGRTEKLTVEENKMVRTGVTLSYGNLWAGMRKGMRTGTWRKLRFLDKVLYRAAMSYAKHHCITNGMLVKKLLALIEKLKETNGMRIFKRGSAKAAALLQRGEETGVFSWAPKFKDWLKDPVYIFWLGTVRF